ncbi:MAG: ACT domain-containing protein [Blautia sp.]
MQSGRKERRTIPTSRFPAEIKIYVNNRTGVRWWMFSKILTEMKIDLTGVNSRTNKQGTATITMSFDVHSKEELNSHHCQDPAG